jgi:hypothetical protein
MTDIAAIPVNTVPNAIKKPKGFQPGVSGNPKGKPKGAQHKVTKAAMVLLNGEIQALTRKVIEMALDGDVSALRMCLDRLVPPLKATLPPVQIDMNGAVTLEEMAKVFVRAAASGEVSPDIATQLISAVSAAARTGKAVIAEDVLDGLMNKPYKALKEDEKKQLLYRLLDEVRIETGRKSIQEMTNEELEANYEMYMQKEIRRCDVSDL